MDELEFLIEEADERSAPFYPRHLIRSYINEGNLTWVRVIAELIDNALDAGARNIRMDYDRAANILVVTDDGRGCPDLGRMVALGATRPHAGVPIRSGRYGMGGKVSQQRPTAWSPRRPIAVRECVGVVGPKRASSWANQCTSRLALGPAQRQCRTIGDGSDGHRMTISTWSSIRLCRKTVI
jgi:hypothetical protein